MLMSPPQLCPRRKCAYYLINVEPSVPRPVREKIEHMVFDLSNAILGHAPEDLIGSKKRSLLDYLDVAISRYGSSIYLLATKADFMEALDEQLAVYQRALSLAIVFGDHDEVFMIHDSLLNLYTSEGMTGEIDKALRFCTIYAEQNSQEENPDYQELLDEFGQ